MVLMNHFYFLKINLYKYITAGMDDIKVDTFFKKELESIYHNVNSIIEIKSNDGTVMHKLQCTKVECRPCNHVNYNSIIRVWHKDILTGNDHGRRDFHICEECVKRIRSVIVKNTMNNPCGGKTFDQIKAMHLY